MNYHGILNSNNVLQSLHKTQLYVKKHHIDFKTLQELKEIRDGFKECIGFTLIILLQHYLVQHALNNICFIYLFSFYIDIYLFLNIHYIICTFAKFYHCSTAMSVLLCMKKDIINSNNARSTYIVGEQIKLTIL